MMFPSISFSRLIPGPSTNESSAELTISACDVVSVRIRRRRRRRSDTNRILASSSTSSASSCTTPRPLVLLFVALTVFYLASKKIAPVHSLSAAKNIWINNSLQYYNRITRGAEHVQQSPTYLKSAMENYFAREKIKINKPEHAESIYRRLIKDEHTTHHAGAIAAAVVGVSGEEEEEEHECKFSNLAVPTLLLGLLLQREGRFNDARIVFEGFSHVLEEASIANGTLHIQKCSCCARVLQAHALFEMKHNNPLKAVELIILAVQMDKKLRPVLRWKLFKDAFVQYQSPEQRQHRRKLLVLKQQQSSSSLLVSPTTASAVVS
ncbi:hypothetical protein FRACYDRAFT_251236 [Fragilariopsis cylindrus CCMP1102]|uniref:Uncharacterized protein n=1 Tax=Fragilariopsis cylindrus CCMP1102 TaxID=635003 RepID=A0A1E7END9_9STRA|nr:hypothetical protein FRACYDRAFT_251236 [Fragilariopsis cylindrus CCMP1102]|eukprot:OEU07431.1 hypothetical protein FRACYDRAFT_251236 [Fragilariopsis cylindrus CCMP1102]